MKDLKKYFKNQLSENTDEELTSKLLTNHYDNQLKSNWSNKLENEHGVAPPSSSEITTSNSFRTWLSIAASFLLILVAYSLYNAQSDKGKEQLAVVKKSISLQINDIIDDELLNKYENLSLKKGIDTQTLRVKAANAYDTEKFSKAIALYEELLNTDEHKIEDQFYYGLCFLFQQPVDAQNAINALELANEMPISNSFRSKKIINWYLSLAYIKAEQYDLAKEMLEVIANDSISIQKDKANTLLELINRRI